MDDTEVEQFEIQLAEWERKVLEADQYLMRIPRTRVGILEIHSA